MPPPPIGPPPLECPHLEQHRESGWGGAMGGGGNGRGGGYEWGGGVLPTPPTRKYDVGGADGADDADDADDALAIALSGADIALAAVDGRH